MFAYTIRRLLAAIPILLVATFLTFWLISLTGDPVAAEFEGRHPRPPQQTFDLERQRLGVNDGFWVQYYHWIKNLVLHGDFGASLNRTDNVRDEIFHALGVTSRLVIAALLISLILAVITGVYSAVKQYSPFDYTATFIGFLFLAMPSFWIAQLLKRLAVQFNLAIGHRVFFTFGESSGHVSGFWNQIADAGGHLILPTVSLSLISYAASSRFQRAAMLDVLNSDYIRLARAKGLRARTVLIRHALRTALIPMTTVTALGIAATFGGAVITESVFQWNGMGRLLIGAVTSANRNVVLGWLLVTGTFVIIGNLIADILYGVLDPRIRYE
ncbi:MAG TPA: ABC transporter permease [Rugosimonospora sp.]|nr:ABC transporter permease [Rugosimonospora sp.]